MGFDQFYHSKAAYELGLSFNPGYIIYRLTRGNKEGSYPI